MSTERAEGYHEALSSVRSTIQRRVKAADISHEGKLELLDLLSMLDDMLNSGKRDEDADRSPTRAPERQLLTTRRHRGEV